MLSQGNPAAQGRAGTPAGVGAGPGRVGLWELPGEVPASPQPCGSGSGSRGRAGAARCLQLGAAVPCWLRSSRRARSRWCSTRSDPTLGDLLVNWSEPRAPPLAPHGCCLSCAHRGAQCWGCPPSPDAPELGWGWRCGAHGVNAVLLRGPGEAGPGAALRNRTGVVGRAQLPAQLQLRLKVGTAGRAERCRWSACSLGLR